MTMLIKGAVLVFFLLFTTGIYVLAKETFPPGPITAVIGFGCVVLFFVLVWRLDKWQPDKDKDKP